NLFPTSTAVKEAGVATYPCSQALVNLVWSAPGNQPGYVWPLQAVRVPRVPGLSPPAKFNTGEPAIKVFPLLCPCATVPFGPAGLEPATHGLEVTLIYATGNFCSCFR